VVHQVHNFQWKLAGQFRYHTVVNTPAVVTRAEVWKEVGRGESQFKTRDHLADRRCSQAVLEFLSTTDVGRLVPTEAARCRNGSRGSGGRGKRSEG